MNINWNQINELSRRKMDIPLLQQLMLELYNCKYTPCADKQLKINLLNDLQMIIFYQEYCNVTLKSSLQQLTINEQSIEKQITQLEEKLIRSKQQINRKRTEIQKLRESKKTKKEEIKFGCIFCDTLTFQDQIQLDKHHKIHESTPSILPQLNLMNQQTQCQLASILEQRQRINKINFMEQNFRQGQLAAAERHAQLVKSEFPDLLEQKYIQYVKLMEEQSNNLKNIKIKSQDQDLERIDGCKEQLVQKLTVQQLYILEFKKQETLRKAQLAKEQLEREQIQKQEEEQKKQLLLEMQMQQNQEYFKMQQSRRIQQQSKNTSLGLNEFDGDMSINDYNQLFQAKHRKFIQEYDNYNQNVKEILLKRIEEGVYIDENEKNVQEIKIPETPEIPEDDIEQLEIMLNTLTQENQDFCQQVRKIKQTTEEHEQENQFDKAVTLTEETESNQDESEKSQMIVANIKMKMSEFPFKILENKNQGVFHSDEGYKGYGANTFSINY